MDRVVDLAMSGAFDDLAQALARRSARPLATVKALVAEANAAKLGTLVRQAGYGRTLLAAIATGQERQGRKADLLTMMVAYENARAAAAVPAGASAPLKAVAR
jgi:3D (Asp-Asp-Asp) domain-containing protein